MYADNGKTAGENDADLSDIVAALQPRDMGGFEKGTQGADDPYASLLWPVTRILTANEMLSQSAGLRLMITYLALYIGFVFLISTAAILAIQQLSQASDSTPRYRILWKLGCDRGMIYRSLLARCSCTSSCRWVWRYVIPSAPSACCPIPCWTPSACPRPAPS